MSNRPYPAYYDLIPFLGGVVDPLTGVLTTLLRIFVRTRFPRRADTPLRRTRGITFILGGIEGPSQYATWIARGILRSRYRGAVVLFPWNRGIPLLNAFRNLMNTRHHERESDALRDAIIAYAEQHPGRPINLVAQSGGCWITMKAIEKLPAAVRPNAVAWLAPSISPGRDITTIAAKCHVNLVSVGGPGDFFFLAFGTTLFGTSDRTHTPSAGWIGWHYCPPGFVEIRWHPKWIRLGYLGNHTTSSVPTFVRDVIGPYLKGTALRV